MVELGSVLAKLTDGSHSSPTTREDGYSYITVRDLHDGIIDTTGCKKISEIDYINLVKSGCKPTKNDVLFSKDGTVGKTAIVTEEIDFVVLSSLAILTPDMQKIDPMYLYYYLSTERFINEATENKTGVAIRRIVLKTLKTIRIPLPDLSVQKQIAEKIEFERNLIVGSKNLLDIHTQKIQDRISKVWGD